MLYVPYFRSHHLTPFFSILSHFKIMSGSNNNNDTKPPSSATFNFGNIANANIINADTNQGLRADNASRSTINTDNGSAFNNEPSSGNTNSTGVKRVFNDPDEVAGTNRTKMARRVDTRDLFSSDSENEPIKDDTSSNSNTNSNTNTITADYKGGKKIKIEEEKKVKVEGEKKAKVEGDKKKVKVEGEGGNEDKDESDSGRPWTMVDDKGSGIVFRLGRCTFVKTERLFQRIRCTCSGGRAAFLACEAEGKRAYERWAQE